MKNGVTMEKIGALADYAEDPRFTARERVALEFADRMTRTDMDVTDAFVRYAQPLIGNDWPAIPLIAGRVRLAQLQPVFADKKLPSYTPQADRK